MINIGFFGEGDSKLSKFVEGQIWKALNSLSSDTCLSFREIKVEDEEKHLSEGIIRYQKLDGCFSGLGRTESNRISIGQGCHSIPIIKHETFHTLGFLHEQSRADRDEYVQVHYENIRKKNHGQFWQMNEDQWVDQDVVYDYGSVMQYGGYSFSKG